MFRSIFKLSVGALLLGHLLSSQSHAAWGEGLRGSDLCRGQQNFRSCLEVYIKYRCQLYGGFHFGWKSRCLRMARVAPTVFDAAQLIDGEHTGYVAFATDLVALLRQREVVNMLSDLRDRLESAYDQQNEEEPFDFYAYILEKAGNNRTKAFRWLGVLFQDTSESKAPIDYIRRNRNIPRTTKSLYSAVLDLLEPEQLGDNDFEKWLKLYPSDTRMVLGRSVNQTFYHFYTIAHYAKQMRGRARDYYDRHMAFFIPFMINQTYEYRQLDSRSWPLRDPGRFNRENHQWNLQDMYAGYLGGIYGALVSSMGMSFYQFSVHVSYKPHDSMLQLIRGSLNIDFHRRR